jgi:hypothetical protein
MKTRDLLVVVGIVVPAVVLLVPLRSWWFTGGVYIWLTPFVLMAGGALFAWLSLLLLEEYRKVFMSDPMSLMSLEVLLTIVRCGAPGALGALGLVAGALFFGSGVLLLVHLLFWGLPELWQAIRLSLGG